MSPFYPNSTQKEKENGIVRPVQEKKSQIAGDDITMEELVSAQNEVSASLAARKEEAPAKVAETVKSSAAPDAAPEKQASPAKSPEILAKQRAITRAALLGAAVGDAFGVPYEFLPRADVEKLPLYNMEGCNTGFSVQSRWGSRIPAGAWSDDTSMAVAVMDSIIRHQGKANYEDHMRSFINWWFGRQYTALDFPFGLGGVISHSLRRFQEGTPALQCGGAQYMDNGNGALMRIFPSSLLCIFAGYDLAATAEEIGNSSAITHGHGISKMSCLIFTEILRALIDGKTILEALKAIRLIDYSAFYPHDVLIAMNNVLAPNFEQLGPEQIGETGYVVDTLLTALYSLVHSSSYEEAIYTAVRLGYDTDTSAAVTGALAGAYYGEESIPQRWLAALAKRNMLEDLADRFAAVV